MCLELIRWLSGGDADSVILQLEEEDTEGLNDEDDPVRTLSTFTQRFTQNHNYQPRGVGRGDALVVRLMAASERLMMLRNKSALCEVSQCLNDAFASTGWQMS